MTEFRWGYWCIDKEGNKCWVDIGDDIRKGASVTDEEKIINRLDEIIRILTTGQRFDIGDISCKDNAQNVELSYRELLEKYEKLLADNCNLQCEIKALRGGICDCEDDSDYEMMKEDRDCQRRLVKKLRVNLDMACNLIDYLDADNQLAQRVLKEIREDTG